MLKIDNVPIIKVMMCAILLQLELFQIKTARMQTFNHKLYIA